MKVKLQWTPHVYYLASGRSFTCRLLTVDQKLSLRGKTTLVTQSGHPPPYLETSLI